jgi:hypothetical protein
MTLREEQRLRNIGYIPKEEKVTGWWKKSSEDLCYSYTLCTVGYGNQQ